MALNKNHDKSLTWMSAESLIASRVHFLELNKNRLIVNVLYKNISMLRFT